MDLIKSHKHRSRISEAMYILLNVLLALAMFAVTYVSGSPWIAVALVSMSKWRVLAVRPRFWLANLITNTVDLIVGLSYVTLVYCMMGSVGVQVALRVLYIVWLLIIKPCSKHTYVVVQAGAALFLGLTTVSMMMYEWNPACFVAASWIIGCIAMRHVINTYDEPYSNLYSFVFGVVTAELAWISYHWMAAYAIPGLSPIRLSQFALFTTLFYFVAERAYRSYHAYGEVRRNDIIPPVVLTALVVIATYVFAVIYGSDAL